MATFKKTKNWFSRLIIAKCRSKVLQNEEHSAILPTFIKLPFVMDSYVLSIFEWPFYAGFTVEANISNLEVNSVTLINGW